MIHPAVVRTFMISCVLLLSLARPAQTKWYENGVQVSEALMGPQITTDGAGGAIITGFYNDVCEGDRIYASRVDSFGDRQWFTAIGTARLTHSNYIPYHFPFRRAYHLTSDGVGGAIIVWINEENGDDTIRAQRLGPNGNARWLPDGVVIKAAAPDSVHHLHMTLDGAGGAIMTWMEKEEGAPINPTAHLYVQRITPSGDNRWAPGGTLVHTLSGYPEDGHSMHPLIISDGARGAVVAWLGYGEGLRVQRIDSVGVIQWDPNGVVAGQPQETPWDMAADGVGGCVLSWARRGSGFMARDIYAQKLSSDGVAQWNTDGVFVGTVVVPPGSNFPYSKIVSDAAGGAIVQRWSSFHASMSTYAQRIDAVGNTVWQAGGITPWNRAGPSQIIPNGDGGAFIVVGGDDVHAQLVDPDGNLLWGEDGVDIGAADGYQLDPQAVADGVGQFIVAWQDEREDTPGLQGLYAQRTGLWGCIVKGTTDFPITIAGDTTSTTITLNNRFDFPLRLEGLNIPQGTFFFQQGFADSLLSGITINPHSHITRPVYFRPLSSGDESHWVFVLDSTGTDIAVTRLEGTAVELTFEWTSSDLYADRILDADEALIIEQTMADFVEVDSLVIFYSVGGGRTFEKKTMTLLDDDPINDRYIGYLPAGYGGSRGLQFYVGAYRGATVVYKPPPDSPERLRIRVNDLDFDNPQPPLRYSLISFPLDITGNSIVGLLFDDLGGRDATAWRMWHHPETGLPYVEIPTREADTLNVESLEQGRGYWLITREAVTLDTGPSIFASTATDSSYRLTLTPGWNLIGNPFNFPVAWESLLVDTLGPVPITINDALSTTLEPPYGYESGYRTDVTTLIPFEGYWVKNLKDSVVTLLIPPWEAPDTLSTVIATTMKRSANPGAPGDGWNIGLQVSAKEVRDFVKYAGVGSGAVKERDRYDRSEPPMSPGKSISLYFPHSTWSPHPGNYASDFRGGDDEYIWRFDVAKNFSDGTAGDEVVLEFSGIEDVPAEAEIILVDQEVERRIDVRGTTRYTFFQGIRKVVTKEEDARFILLVGSDEFIDSHDDRLPRLPTETVLHQNHPNPFNPSTITRYELAHADRVTLQVYDVSGALVKVLEDCNRPADRYEVGWNGDNERGERVSSGVYFYRLTAGNRTLTKKMVLLR